MQLSLFFSPLALLFVGTVHVSAAVHPRAIGGICVAPEGNGTCELKSSCPGISYPTGLCPDDPVDVQCCVNLPCNLATAGSGLCRSISNNGCTNGEFYAGACPGSMDIQCCIPNLPTPLILADEDLCTPSAADTLVFTVSMATFQTAKEAQEPSCFDWSSDGCTCAPDDVGDLDFLQPCQRHDFGYRNAKAMGRFDEAFKLRVDENFRGDLYAVCEGEEGDGLEGVECKAVADLYVEVVESVELKRRRDTVPGGGLGKRECDILRREVMRS